MTDDTIVRPLAHADGFSVRRRFFRCFYFYLRTGFRVAVNAIVHGKRFERPPRWLIQSFHRTVAGLTLNFCYRNMDPVGKKHMTGQPPDPLPRDFQVFLPVSFDFLYLRILRLHGPVASHAHSNGWPPGDHIRFDSCMTSVAGKTLCDVFLMREPDRLFDAPHTPTRPEKQSHRPCCDKEP